MNLRAQNGRGQRDMASADSNQAAEKINDEPASFVRVENSVDTPRPDEFGLSSLSGLTGRLRATNPLSFARPRHFPAREPLFRALSA
ncbi:hypothetical protein QCE63_17650 [Caballeronia sp. LZ065]|uniref:hypothetical protein n=1 Tax=Caballeronia sp. LZ065 TaxID=3038571 RepID=UPI0028600E38|nr:hypothetical protein [Caballeronia sp. LZ065]MDR5781231.1 hypothetical protein [Caballeronia sp. LZ065]